MTEFDKMVRLLNMAWPMRKQIVPCLVGPPGIGKTAAVQRHAENHGSKVVKIVASRCIPSETVGMTMPNHEHRSMEIYNSVQLSSLKDGDILFLDELLEADQYVLSTLLTVIESREMADGTPLPDIQIVAATNDTISPEQLKGNIRQRFMFQRFRVDRDQTRAYILELTGIDVGSITSRLCDDGTDYNFMTPRSLTKLCLWVDSIDKEDVDAWATIVNEMWNSAIGSEIARARRRRDRKLESPEQQVRSAVMDMVDDALIPLAVAQDNNDFKDCTMNELLAILREQANWNAIELRLLNIEIDDDDVAEENEITF